MSAMPEEHEAGALAPAPTESRTMDYSGEATEDYLQRRRRLNALRSPQKRTSNGNSTLQTALFSSNDQLLADVSGAPQPAEEEGALVVAAEGDANAAATFTAYDSHIRDGIDEVPQPTVRDVPDMHYYRAHCFDRTQEAEDIAESERLQGTYGLTTPAERAALAAKGAATRDSRAAAFSEFRDAKKAHDEKERRPMEELIKGKEVDLSAGGPTLAEHQALLQERREKVSERSLRITRYTPIDVVGELERDIALKALVIENHAKYTERFEARRLEASVREKKDVERRRSVSQERRRLSIEASKQRAAQSQPQQR